MPNGEQPAPGMDRMSRLVGWSLLLGLFSIVAIWIAIIFEYNPGQVVLPSWVVPTLTAFGMALFVVSASGLLIAVRYLRQLMKRQQRP